MNSRQSLLLAGAFVFGLIALAGCDSASPSGPGGTRSDPGGTPSSKGPGGKHWSSPDKYTMNKSDYVGGHQIQIRPAEDNLLEPDKAKKLVIRFRWQPGGGKPLAAGNEVCAKLIYAIRDTKGATRFSHMEAVVKLGAESETTEVDYETAWMPRDDSFNDERDCLFYLTKSIEDREPVSNVIVFRCRSC